MAVCSSLIRWLLLMFLTNFVRSDVMRIFAPNPPNSVNVSDLKSTVASLVNNVRNRLRCVDHGLNPTDCNKCLDANKIFELLNVDTASKSLSLRNAEDLALLLVHHILYFESMCTAASPVGCTDFSKCQEEVLDAFGVDARPKESLQKLLRIFKLVLKQDYAKECIGVEEILHNLPQNESFTPKQEIRQILRILMGRIFEGYCIDAEETVSDFLDDIFHHYGDSCSPYMSLNGLKRIINDLQNTGHNHDHGPNHNHPNDHDHSHDAHGECEHKHELFSLYHSHDHNHTDPNFNSVSNGRLTGHAHHDHHDHSDHDHSHGHSGHDHDHSIKHDRLVHSHGDDDSHDTDHVQNGKRNDYQQIQSEAEHGDELSSEEKHTHKKESQHHAHKHIEEHGDGEHEDDAHDEDEHEDEQPSEHPDVNSQNTTSHSDDIPSSLASAKVTLHVVDVTSSYNATEPSEDHLEHYGSTVLVSGSDSMLRQVESTVASALEVSKGSTKNIRVHRSSPDKDPASPEDVKTADFNAPSASLKSDFSHQEEGHKDHDEDHHHAHDEVKKVYLLRNTDEARKVDSASDVASKRFASLATKCLSAGDLILKFGHQYNSSLTKSDFLELCPALIQQIVSGVCAEPIPARSPLPSHAEVYGYGSLSVLIISLTSLAGVLLLPVMTKRAYNYIIGGFYGLAFSTLAGDAMLHLMPQFLGLHSHGSDGSHDHSHEGNSFLEPYTQLQLGVFFTIYGLFLFEALLCAFSSKGHGHHSSQDSKGHGHSHAHLSDELPTLISVKTKSETQLPVSRDQSSSSLDTEIVEMDSIKKPPNLMVSKPIFLGMTSMALVVTLGDSIHNFGDGLAIGAAFSTGVRGGLSTAIAVFCHELPHEFGDFVVLLSTGLSFSKAMIINFLSGLTCFIGLYIGIYIGDNEIARKWIMAVTAGIFLYVALGEMIPELREHGQGSPVKMLIVKNVGILAGIMIMLVISMYEGEMF